MRLRDTGGLERVASITNSYYKFAEAGKLSHHLGYLSQIINRNFFAALLVFSLSSLDSFHCLSQHLIEILSMAENAKIFLVGNKLDLEPHEVTDEIVDLFIEQFPKFNGYFKISCKHNIGIEEMFNEISKCLASSNFSFKDTFDTFTLHGTHSHSENCCSPSDHDPNDCHSHSEQSSSTVSSCCANS